MSRSIRRLGPALAVAVFVAHGCTEIPSAAVEPTTLDVSISAPDTVLVHDTIWIEATVVAGRQGVLTDPPIIWAASSEFMKILEVQPSRIRVVARGAGRAHVVAIVDPENRGFVGDAGHAFIQTTYGEMELYFDGVGRDTVVTALDLPFELRGVVEGEGGRPVVEGDFSVTSVPSDALDLDLDASTGALTAVPRAAMDALLILGHSTCRHCADTLEVKIRQEAATLEALPGLATSLATRVQLVSDVRDAGGAPIEDARVRWRLQDPADSLVAAVSGSGARGRSPGVVPVIAELGALADTTLFTVAPWITRVSIEGLPALAEGLDESYTARLVRHDSAGNVIPTEPVRTRWSVSDPSILALEATGLVEAEIGTRAYGVVFVKVDAWGCEDPCESASDSVRLVVSPVVDSIRISLDRDTLTYIDDTTQARALVYSGGAAVEGVRVEWRSLDRRIADVDSTGVVLGRFPGQAMIEARVDPFTASTPIVVEQVPAEVTLPVAPALVIGATHALTPEVTDSGGYHVFDPPPATWSSSDASVLEVDGDGVLRGAAEGAAVIGVSVGGVSAETTVLAIPADYRFAASASSVCIITSSGSTYCGLDRLAPFPFSDVVELSEGHGSMCARDTSGRVLCLGNNDAGQLGVGDRLPKYIPTEIAGSADLDRIAIVGLRFLWGSRHSCGLDGTGQAYCWGSNTEGQLGMDTTATWVTEPRRVETAQRFDDIAVAGEQSCGLNGDGVWCWGTAYTRMPTHVLDTEAITQSLAIGPGFGCGLSGEGAVWCWGQAAQGPVGSGTPARALTEAEGHTFTLIDVGLNHACGLEPGGAVYCWGDNDRLQLGDGTFYDRAEPVLAAGGQTFDDLAAGQDFTAARTPGGSIWLWGEPANPISEYWDPPRDWEAGFFRRVLVVGIP